MSPTFHRHKLKLNIFILSLNNLFYEKISLLSSPVLIGTGSFALAVSIGPIGIASAIGTSGLIISAILAHYVYHEKLKLSQWIGLLIVTLGILGLNLF